MTDGAATGRGDTGGSVRILNLLDQGVDRMRERFLAYAPVLAALGLMSAALAAGLFVGGGRVFAAWVSAAPSSSSWRVLLGVAGGALGWLLIQASVTTVSVVFVGRLEWTYSEGGRLPLRATFVALSRTGRRAWLLGLSLFGLLGGVPLILWFAGLLGLWMLREVAALGWTSFSVMASGFSMVVFAGWSWLAVCLSLAPSVLASDDDSVGTALRRSFALVRGGRSTALALVAVFMSLTAFVYMLGFAWMDGPAFELASLSDVQAMLPALGGKQAVGLACVELLMIPLRTFMGICWMSFFFRRDQCRQTSANPTFS